MNKHHHLLQMLEEMVDAYHGPQSEFLITYKKAVALIKKLKATACPNDNPKCTLEAPCPECCPGHIFDTSEGGICELCGLNGYE